jgi:hypothetical protein
VSYYQAIYKAKPVEIAQRKNGAARKWQAFPWVVALSAAFHTIEK